MNILDIVYQDLLRAIIHSGVKKQTRNGETLSLFGYQIRHDMSDGFPLLTTKKMAWKSIVTELLWFLRGDTNIKYLVDNGCHIWDGDCYQTYLKKCENVIKVNTPVFELNGKSIIIQTYNNGFPELKEDEILYKYNENRGYIGRKYTKEEFINKIKTDDEFAKQWGELGPIYGKQWRKWGSFKDRFEFTDNGKGMPIPVHTSWDGIDQIANLISELKTNPDSRRLMVNSWNVGELDTMVLPPCHYGFQVYTRELSLKERLDLFDEFFDVTHNSENMNELEIHKALSQSNIPTRAISLMWNQRSVDTFLGLPFNIASYGLLLEIIAKEVNMVPDELIGNLGDVHLYSNHIEQAKEQIGRERTHEEMVEIYNKLEVKKDREGNWTWETRFEDNNIKRHTREPFKLPRLMLPNMQGQGIFDYSPTDIEIWDYESHPAIKAPLSN